MKTVLQFLRDLAQHNDRAWFNEHKERYLAVQQRWNEFCESLIGEIGAFDPDIARLTLRDCTYRIYRDTRFSPDKSPYKTHFGVFLAPGGKKSMHAGYYFHVGTGESNEYPQGHMLAAGNYCYEPKAIQILREDISDGWESFQNEVVAVADPRFVVDQEGALKRVPKGYAPDAPYADWMRLKSYCLVMNVDDDFIIQPDLAKRVADLFRTTKPFNDYINRAVDFVHGK
ncbi:DUF2461 domain-containing protein [Parabacteroides distasonis]|nr:DUF2461 domain-containing protein [Parabacteroides distasonis]